MTIIFNRSQHIFGSSQLHVSNTYGYHHAAQKKENKCTVAFRIDLN